MNISHCIIKDTLTGKILSRCQTLAASRRQFRKLADRGKRGLSLFVAGAFFTGN